MFDKIYPHQVTSIPIITQLIRLLFDRATLNSLTCLLARKETVASTECVGRHMADPP